MYEILLWRLKPMFTIFSFVIKIKILKNYPKCFLFHQKCSFSPRDFHIFVFYSSPFFTFYAITDFIEEVDW